jgi:hypothetical protein
MAINSLNDIFRELNFNEYHQILLDNSYYELLFPFLLLFSVLYTVLSYAKIFRSKSTGEPVKPIIFIISLIVSWFGVGFETSAGYSVGKLLMLMFPNISALTIGFLCLYIIGAILGKDLLRGLFDKNNSAYIYYALGAIGLGSVVFYVGIAMGIWDFNPFDTESYWNVILGLAFLILGIVMLIIGRFGIGFVFLFVFGSFVYGGGQGNILEYFIDPVMFIVVIFVVMISWLTSRDEKEKLAADLRKSEFSIEEYKRMYGGKVPEDYESRVFDNLDSAYNSNKKKWERKYPGEKY